MKSIRLPAARFAVASVMTLALAGAALAQPMDRPAPMAMHHGFGGMQGDRLRHLGLTEAQQDQIFKLHHDQAPEMRERMKAARRAHSELLQSAKAMPFDRDRARQLADAEAKALAQIAFMRVEMMSRVRAVLTDEQRAKLEARRGARHGGGAK
jgi:Spy/CpxP family protein refolding chaperone